MTIALDMYQTVALAVLVFFMGKLIREKVSFFTKYCIPAPVIGGIIVAIVLCIGQVTGAFMFEMDTTLQAVFMTIFFTSVGYTACFRLLKKGGIQVLIFLAVCIVLVVLQDIVGVACATVFGLNPMLGLCTGSIPMTGGHGTAASFGPMLEELGVVGANTVAVASATFGLVMGCAIGGPLARRRIEKMHLEPKVTEGNPYEENNKAAAVREVNSNHFMNAMSLLLLAMGLGSIVFNLFKSMGLTVPTYIGAMLVAAVIRNIADVVKWDLPEKEIDVLGGVCLSLFLSMALMTLKLWQLADLALPLIVSLLAQTVLMGFFAYFVTFNFLGRDYEAAVLLTAHCGFGMGATPNAMANMQAVSAKYGPAPKAFFIVPLIGSLFIDFFNAAIITTFVNILN